jgi:hypothetical protein
MALQTAGFSAATSGVTVRVSLWKNERKIRLREPVKGGLKTPDRLYDSRA